MSTSASNETLNEQSKRALAKLKINHRALYVENSEGIDEPFITISLPSSEFNKFVELNPDLSK